MAQMRDDLLARARGEMNHVAWLPNRAGFRFLAVLTDGRTEVCSVTVGPDRLHRVLERPLAEIRGWFPLAEQKAKK